MRKCTILLIIALLMLTFAVPVGTVNAADGDPVFKLEGKSWADGDAIISTFNVKDYGAVGDGVHDDTKAIKDALERCILYGCGIVFFPEGTYRITENLTVSAKSTVLRGMWKSPREGGSGKGTVIMADLSPEEAGNAPLLSIEADGCTVMEMSFWYPQQTVSNITPYPWTIAAQKGAVHGTTVKRLTLYNSYEGIALYNSAVHAQEIYGTILKTGLVLDYNLEVSDVTRVYLSNEVWTRSTLKNSPTSDEDQKKLFDYTSKNATGIEFGRIDDIWAYDINVNSIDFKTGLRSYQSTDLRSDITGGPYGHVMNIGKTSVQVDAVTKHYPQNPDLMLDFVDKTKGSEAYRYTFEGARVPSRQKLYVVTDYGAAGNGTADDTGAIQKTLDQAAKDGGGIVLLPKGKFKVNGSLTIPSKVELRGLYESEHNLQTLAVSTILAYGEKGKADGTPLITLKAKSGVHGITIYYPELAEEFSKTKKITKYPWTVKGEGKGVWAEYVVLNNSVNGINLADKKCDDFLLRGVWGSCAETGLKVGGGSSGGKIESLFFSYALWYGLPGFSPYNPAEKSNSILIKLYFTENAIGYVFENCKNITIFSGSVFGLQKGMVFNKGAEKFTIYRALLDQPGKTKCLNLNGGDNITILGMSSGTNNAGILAADGFSGKVRIYGRNSWGRGKDTESYDQNIKRKDIITYENPNPGIDKLSELNVPAGTGEWKPVSLKWPAAASSTSTASYNSKGESPTGQGSQTTELESILLIVLISVFLLVLIVILAVLFYKRSRKKAG